MYKGLSATALKEWKLTGKVTKGLKDTITDGRVGTVYCIEDRKWDVKTVFLFICCNGDMCSPCGVHYRTRNSGFHFKVWKSQERSFNGKDHEVQEYIAGQDVGDSRTEVIVKQV